jgi:hypothetical protein
MISDVLSDSLTEIRTYQQDSEAIYDDLKQAISAVCEVMDALRQHLDTPPAPALHDALRGLQAAIGRLDLVEIRDARKRLVETWQEACGPDIKLGLSRDDAGYVDVAIHLFGTPEFELQDYELTGQGIREYAAHNSGWLAQVAEAVDKLFDDGWTLQVVKNSIEARHPDVRTCDDATSRLRLLGIEETVIDVAEWSADGERLTPA